MCIYHAFNCSCGYQNTSVNLIINIKIIYAVTVPAICSLTFILHVQSACNINSQLMIVKFTSVSVLLTIHGVRTMPTQFGTRKDRIPTRVYMVDTTT